MEFIVTEKAQRPANINGKCFYCQQVIGEPHKEDCVLIKKKTKVCVIIEYDIETVESWDKEMIEFHRNNGTWCADNLIDELTELSSKQKRGCLCSIAKFKYIRNITKPYLKE